MSDKLHVPATLSPSARGGKLRNYAFVENRKQVV